MYLENVQLSSVVNETFCQPVIPVACCPPVPEELAVQLYTASRVQVVIAKVHLAQGQCLLEQLNRYI